MVIHNFQMYQNYYITFLHEYLESVYPNKLPKEPNLNKVSHSRLRPFLIKLQAPETKTTQGWSVWFKDSKNVLHEILANRAWKGRAS